MGRIRAQGARPGVRRWRSTAMLAAVALVAPVGASWPAARATTAYTQVPLPAGSEPPTQLTFSGDGRYLGFTVGHRSYIYDLRRRVLEPACVSSSGKPADCEHLSLSWDGRYVAFESVAGDLVPDDRNFIRDVFVRDRRKRTTRRISLDAAGREILPPPTNDRNSQFAGMAPVISGNGAVVAYFSNQDVFPPVIQGGTSQLLRYDLVRRKVSPVTVADDGRVHAWTYPEASLSYDGRYVAFQTNEALVASDTDNPGEYAFDVYVRDAKLGRTTLVSAVTVEPGVSRRFDQQTIDATARRVAYVERDYLPNVAINHHVVLRDGPAGAPTSVYGGGSVSGELTEGTSAPQLTAKGDYLLYTSETGAGNPHTAPRLYWKHLIPGGSPVDITPVLGSSCPAVPPVSSPPPPSAPPPLPSPSVGPSPDTNPIVNPISSYALGYEREVYGGVGPAFGYEEQLVTGRVTPFSNAVLAAGGGALALLSPLDLAGTGCPIDGTSRLYVTRPPR